MNNSYVYSPSTNMFYPYVLEEDYRNAGSWPEDAVDVSDEIVAEYNDQYPPGKTRAAVDGMPGWVDITPPTKEETIQANTNIRDYRISDATSKITVWQTKLLIGRKLTDDEMSQLNMWLDYIDALTVVDLENPVWPEV